MGILNWQTPALAAALSAAAAFAQQHGYTPGDVEEGGKLYRANCIGCHETEGTSVTGIDLGHQRYRRVSTDEGVVNVILNGVPGTGMPGGIVTSPARGYVIVAYLHSMNENTGVKSIAAGRGDIARGRALFTRATLNGNAGCNTCHRVYGTGGRAGPDLSETGLLLRPIEIETSILDPDAGVSSASQPFRAVKKDGVTITGALLNQDTHTVQLIDASQGRLVSLPKADLRESGFVAKSPMPSYRGKLNPQELADLIDYVASLKGASQ